MNEKALPFRALARAALLLGVASLAVGCESFEKTDRWFESQWAVQDHQLPKEQTDIAVRPAEASATVVFAPRSAKLSRDQRELLARFVAGSGAHKGDRALIAISPASGRTLAERRVRSVASVLHRQGLSVARSFVPAGPDAARVTITRLVAVPPNCPQWNDLMQRRMVDEYKPKLGCFDAASLATTVHRAEDLVQGRPSGPSDGAVMDRGVQLLREGKFDPALTTIGTGTSQSAK